MENLEKNKFAAFYDWKQHAMCGFLSWNRIFTIPALGLISCGIAGLSVGIMWPGTFSMASVSIKRGGTAMFALMALAGDLGCAGGPTVVGMVSGHFADNLQMGTLAAIVFPVILCVGLAYTKKVRNV